MVTTVCRDMTGAQEHDSACLDDGSVWHRFSSFINLSTPGDGVHI
jgi:hypothetical protein